MNKPTNETYNELQLAFDYFNNTLFNNLLPSCLITLQRKKRTAGYFSHKQFIQIGSKAFADEIAMNPGYFGVNPMKETLSTLVHEMVHQWQSHYGNPSRACYHNREWAAYMGKIGLIPSSTGKPGGAKTGQQMSDYIQDGGPFDLACNELLTTEFKLSWLDRFPPVRPAGMDGENNNENDLVSEVELEWPPEEPVNRSNRIKYVCGICESQVWGKPNLKILCGNETCHAEPLVG